MLGFKISRLKMGNIFKSFFSNTGEIKNARSILGRNIQWFFDSLDSDHNKIGDDKWDGRYKSFITLNGDLINGAKAVYANKRKYNGVIICENMSDLNDKENRRLILENNNRMKIFSKEFYDTINEILNKWFSNVLLIEPSKERFFGSSLRNRELAEIQFFNDNANYYSFILENEAVFLFADDVAIPIEEFAENYNELATKMNESLAVFKKYNIFSC